MIRPVGYRNDLIYFHHDITQTPRAEDFPMHTHEMCEIYYFMNGNATYRIEGSVYRMKPGTILLMRPSEAHHPLIDSRYPYERMSLHFSPDVFAGMDPDGLLTQAFFNRESGEMNRYESDEFTAVSPSYFFGAMCQETQSQQELYVQIIANALPLLSEIRRIYLQKKNLTWQKPEPNVVRDLVRYLNEHLMDELSLDQLSQQFFLSKSNLCRAFKNSTGESIWNYFIIKRLMDARRRIRLGEPVTLVCQHYANWDYSAFYRAYKKMFGVSPKEDLSYFQTEERRVTQE